MSNATTSRPAGIREGDTSKQGESTSLLADGRKRAGRPRRGKDNSTMSKAIHNLDNTVIPADGGPVNISPSVPDTDAFEHEYQDDPDDRLLRACNGLRDEVVFPRLRENGVPERELHAFAMSLVRDVQYGLDHSGEMRKLLGVRFQGIHGTVADTEVQ